MSDKTQNTESKKYKSYIGPSSRYDFMGATQFRLLTTLGLRQHHKLLDFGCGSLRSGKLFIPYLDVSNYFGIEPNKWLIDEGVANEIGEDVLAIKSPTFMHNDDFEIHFNTNFDYVIAQSIFSHTDRKLATKGIQSIANALTPDGIALITFVERLKDYDGMESWVYPQCTFFKRRTISNIFKELGVHWRRLPWFHPAQTWYLIAREKQNLPSYYSCFFLLGGEEVGSTQYKLQGFFSNRIVLMVKPYWGLLSSIQRVIQGGGKD